MPDPSARCQVRTADQLMVPAVCACCGSGSSERKYFDWNLVYEFYGNFYLCEYCLREAMQQGMADDYIDRSIYMRELLENDSLRSSVKDLTESNRLLEQTIDGLAISWSNSLRGNVGILGDIDPATPELPEPVEDEGLVSPKSGEVAGKGKNAQRKSDGQVVVEGSNDVPQLTDSGLDEFIQL